MAARRRNDNVERRAAIVPDQYMKDVMFAIARIYHEAPVNGIFLSWPRACELGRQHFFNQGLVLVDGVPIVHIPAKNDMPSDAQIKREYFKRKSLGETVQLKRRP
jgi:hypothetical protein